MFSSSDTIFLALVLGRWVHFASVFTLFGTAIFDVIIQRGDLPCSDRGAARRPIALATRIAAAIAALSGIVWLVGAIANMSDGWAEGFDLATLHVLCLETPFGRPFALRLVLLLALFASSVVHVPRARRDAWHLCIGGLLLLSQAWLGHAMAAHTPGLQVAMILSYGVHVIGAATWVGSLPALAYALGLGDRTDTERKILERYTDMATVALTLVVGSGLVNAAVHLDWNVGADLVSSYGRVLVVKILLVVAMLGFAAWNRGIGRRIGTPHEVPILLGLPRLRTNVMLEVGLGLVVLAVTAVLGLTPPPQ